MGKASILSVCIALVSIAVLLGVYQHSENVRHTNRLAIADQNAELQETHRRLTQQMQMYKEKLSDQLRTQHQWAHDKIQQQADSVKSRFLSTVDRETKQLKVEMLADASKELSGEPQRRELKINDASNDFTAILLQSDNSAIKFGINGDSNIYRERTNTLKTDGSFVVGGDLKLGDNGEVTLHTVDQQLSVYGDLNVKGTLSADTLKTNHSHLSYNFPVAETISKGDVVSLLGGKLRKGFGVGVGATDVVSPTASFMKVFKISATLFFATYKNGDAGWGVVGSVDSAGKLTVGAAAKFYSSVQEGEYTAAVVSPTKVAMVYRKKGSTQCFVIVGTIASGNKVTFSTKENKFADKCAIPAAAPLGGDKLGIIFQDTTSGSVGTGLIGKVADANTVNFGSSDQFNSFAVAGLDIAMMEADVAILTFLDSTKSSRPMAQIMSAKGTSVTFQSKKQVSGNTVSSISITSVAADKAVVAFRETKPTSSANLVVIDVVKGYLETGTNIEFSNAESAGGNFDHVSVSAVGGNRVLIALRDGEGFGKIVDGDVVGKMVFLGKRQSFLDAKSSSASVATTGQRWVLIFQDDSDSNKGKARVVTQWGGARALGIAAEGGSSGSVPVILQGVVDAFSGGKFESGGVYFAGNNGGVQPEKGVGVELGRALTDSLLLLENLAAQNLADSAQVSGTISNSLVFRCRGAPSAGDNVWLQWITEFASSDFIEYDHSGRKHTFLSDAIVKMDMHYNNIGHWNQRAEFHLCTPSCSMRVRSWESNYNNGWWGDLNLSDLMRVKKDNYVRVRIDTANTLKGDDAFQYSSLLFWRVQDEYEPKA